MTSRGTRRVSVAMDAFKRGLESFIAEAVCTTYSPRLETATEMAKKLLNQLERSVCASPVNTIVSTIADCVNCGVGGETASIRREKASIAFQEASATALPLNWECLLASIESSTSDRLLEQSVSDNIYKAEILKQFRREGGDGVGVAWQGPSEIEISSDELNALRDMCGFIPYQLLRKFGSSGKNDREAFWTVLERLIQENAAEDNAGDDVGDSIDSAAWIRRANRASLFKVSDEAFDFFVSVERRLRDLLPLMTQSNIQGVREQITEAHDVLLFWQGLTPDADCPEQEELLHEIVSVFVRIRGYSIAASLFEQYKREKGVRVAKSRSLRKSLLTDK